MVVIGEVGHILFLSKKIGIIFKIQQSIMAKRWVPTSGNTISSNCLISGYSASTITITTMSQKNSAVPNNEPEKECSAQIVN